MSVDLTTGTGGSGRSWEGLMFEERPRSKGNPESDEIYDRKSENRTGWEGLAPNVVGYEE